MACSSCKNKSISVKPKETNKKNYVADFFIFLVLSSIFSIVIIPIMLVVLFKSIVLDKNMSIYPMILKLSKKIFDNKEDDEFEELDEDEEELVDQNDIVIIE